MTDSPKIPKVGASDREQLEATADMVLASLNAHEFKSNALLSGRIGRGLLNAGLINHNLDTQHRSNFEVDLDAATSFEDYEDTSYSNGISGCRWFLGYLNRKSHLTKADFVDDDVDDLLHDQAMGLLDSGNYDLLHGAIGHILFSLEDEKMEHAQFIASFIERMRFKAIIDEKGARWPYLRMSDTGKTESRLVINMGMAHGHLGILAFLLKCKIKGVKSEALNVLLRQATDFLIHTWMEFKAAGSHIEIPAAIIDGTFNVGRKLAWCYGDLSSAYTLYRVGAFFRDEGWKDLALGILNGCAREDYREPFPMKDASFCHGTAGASYIFGKLHKETGLPQFRLASETWLRNTLELQHQTSQAAGYSYFDGKEYRPDFGLLEGTAGIGLVLNAHLRQFDKESTDWDSCLYLS